MKNETIYTFSFKLIISIIINYLIIKTTVEALGDSLSILHTILIIIATLSTISVFEVFIKKPSFFIGMTLISFLAILLINHYYRYEFIQFITQAKYFGFWSIRYINRDIYFHSKYFTLFIIAFSIIISLFIYIITFIINKIFPLLFLGTSFFMYRWFMYQDSALNYFYVFILCILFLYVLNRYISNMKKWKEDNIKNYNTKKLFIYSIIFSVLIVLLSLVIPKNNAPITWKWLDNKVQREFPQLTNWRNTLKKSKIYGGDLKFDFTYTQFQNNEDKLGGNIKQEDILIMKVKTKRPLYLRGRVKNYYNGFFWKSTDDASYEQIKNTDIDIDKDIPKYGERISYTIQHINLTTSTLFNSYIPYKVNYNENYYSTDEYELYTNKIIMSSEKYKVYSQIPYFNPQKIQEDYNKYEMFKEYLQLPNTVSNKVRNLSYSLTKDEESDYEKMKVLQNYLRNNYEYTLSPGNNTYKKDFTDHFLFDVKKGYCTYFASSLAVMARSVDIPTRYVEGFLVSEKGKDNLYNVYSSNAHAWVEAYINGYGWMTFEATPIYETLNYQQKNIETDKEDRNINLSNEINNNSELNRKKMERFFMDEDIEINSNIDLKNNDNISGFLIIGIIILILVFIFLVFKIILHIIYIKSLNKLNNKEKVIRYYNEIIELFKILGYTKKDSQTDLEFIHNLEDNMDKTSNLNEIVNIYLKAKYSNTKILKSEIEVIKIALKNTIEVVKKEKGLLKLIFYKYIIGNVKG